MPDAKALKSIADALGLSGLRGLVPGHAVLGKGFNVFGRYSAASTKKALFDTITPAFRIWRDPQSDYIYVIPDNVDDPIEMGTQTGEATFFNSKSSVCEYFGAQASLSAKYGVFSGEFDMAFSEVSKEISEYHLGVLAIRSKSFKLRLLDASEAKLAPSITEDPDFVALPDEFHPDVPENRRAFFAFFEKFGTHYVQEVDMGGRLDYYVYVNKAQLTSEQDFRANLTLEVKASLLSAGAEVNTTWNKLGESWASSRKVRVSATGSSSILNALAPEYGDSFHDVYVQWLVELRYTPMPVDFGLRPIHALFSGKRAQALRDATAAYAGNSLTLVAVGDANLASRTTGYVNLNDKPLSPPPRVGAPGVRAAVFDRKTLTKIDEAVYRFEYTDIDPEANAAYTQLVAKLDPYQGNRDVIVAILFWWVQGTTQYPSLPLYNLLINLGAGESLHAWWGAHHSSSALGYMSYGIVGTFGGVGGGAIETWADWDPRAPRSLLLEAFLKPEYSGADLRYSPA